MKSDIPKRAIQQRRAYDVICMDKRTTPRILAEALGISRAAAWNILNALERRGLVKRYGKHTMYELVEKEED